MRLLITTAIATLLAAAPTSVAVERLVTLPQSRIWIEGTSTVKSFECKVPEFTLNVGAEGASAVAAVLAGQKAVRTIALTVPAARLDCGNGTMNEHMNKALKSDEHQAIRFSLDSYDVAKNGDGVAGDVRGTLELGGVKKPIVVTARGTEGENGALRVTGGYEVALSEFDLKRPSLMFGRIKVGDKVQVKFDIVLKN